MALTLRVTSFHSQALGADSTKVFGAQGGAIGRSLDNDWVLPDPEKFVSSQHAQIVCRGGTYSLKDTSTNGAFVNGSAQPVGNGMEQQLFHGDTIQIADYEIAVSLDASMQAGVTGPTGGFGAGPSVGGGGDDIMNMFDGPATPQNAPSAPSWPGAAPDQASVMDQNFIPPTPQAIHPADTNVIGDDWDKTGFVAPDEIPLEQSGTYNQPSAAPPPPTQAPGMAAGSDQQGVVVMLMAAGLDQASAQAAATPQNLAALGQILGITTQGLIDVLKARAAVKSQFRVPMTMMRSVENNALKSSANAPEALMYLLVNHNPAYLNAVDSYVEGFEDIKAHQMAMMAGMRAAFDSMLDRFDPEELGKRFDKRKSKGMLRMLGSSQYWEMYKTLYEDMTQDADANFQRLFGEEFARAYEEQMQRLTSARGRMNV